MDNEKNPFGSAVSTRHAPIDMKDLVVDSSALMRKITVVTVADDDDDDDDDDDEDDHRQRPEPLDSAFIDLSGEDYSDPSVEEEEEDDDSAEYRVTKRPRTPPPVAHSAEGVPGFFKVFLLGVVFAVAGFYLATTARVYSAGGGSVGLSSALALKEILGVFSAPQAPLVAQNQQLSSLTGPYELWGEEHNTTSLPINYRMDAAKSTAIVLRAAFWLHMSANADLNCLCMHHLHMDRLGNRTVLYQLCGVYNRQQGQLYMMANPKKGGGSTENAEEVTEHSVSCPEDHWRTVRRQRSFYVDWVDPFTQDPTYRLFTGPESYCLQLAMEEMSAPGNAHCN